MILFCRILSLFVLMSYSTNGFEHFIKIRDTSANVEEESLENLFKEGMKSIVSEGPSNRFWNLFLGKNQNDNKRSPVLSRRFDSNQIVQQSPLATNAVVQKSLQASPNSRTIDAMSTISLNISRKLGLKDKITTLKAPNQFCPFEQPIACDSSTKFRSIDGSCNNLQRPWLGKAETPYKRYLPPAYQDGLESPRIISKRGNFLPNPRLISRMFKPDNNPSEDTFTHMIAIFGQFITHDMSSASVSTGNQF